MRASAAACAVLLSLLGRADAALTERTVSYEIEGEEYEGFLAYDDTWTAEQPRSVIVFDVISIRVDSVARRRGARLPPPAASQHTPVPLVGRPYTSRGSRITVGGPRVRRV